MPRRSRESPTLSWRSTDSITTQVLLFDIFGSHLNLLAEHATCIEIICTLYAEIQKGIDTMKTLVGPLYNVPSSHHFNEMEKRSHTPLSTLSIYPSYQTGLNRSKICKGHTTPSTDSITMQVIHLFTYICFIWLCLLNIYMTSITQLENVALAPIATKHPSCCIFQDFHVTNALFSYFTTKLCATWFYDTIRQTIISYYLLSWEFNNA